MRLLTRSDFDGLICGTILTHLGIISEWKFVHPKDMQDNKIEVNENDIICNVPFVKGCGMWFDHHASEGRRLVGIETVKGVWKIAPSCARNVYEYYGGAEKMPQFKEMLDAVDKVDAADLTIDEIKNPAGWILLGFVMDPRTGLGRFRDYTVSNYQLMERLMQDCGKLSIEEILELPDVKERLEVYGEQSVLFEQMLKRCSRIAGNLVISDTRDEEIIYAGNRFMIYSLFPEQNASMWITWGREKQNVAIAVGYSILNKTCQADIGSLMLAYGGGGHRQVGTCQIKTENIERVIEELTEKLK